MGRKREKYYKKSPYKDQIEALLIKMYNLGSRRSGYQEDEMREDMYRVRVCKVRIIFRRDENGIYIVNINTRGDVY